MEDVPQTNARRHGRRASTRARVFRVRPRVCQQVDRSARQKNSARAHRRNRQQAQRKRASGTLSPLLRARALVIVSP
jgi:hypothetical protein